MTAPLPHEDDTLHTLWLVYRLGVKRHIADTSTRPPKIENEAQYRERAEKAGIAFLLAALNKADAP